MSTKLPSQQIRDTTMTCRLALQEFSRETVFFEKIRRGEKKSRRDDFSTVSWTTFQKCCTTFENIRMTFVEIKTRRFENYARNFVARCFLGSVLHFDRSFIISSQFFLLFYFVKYVSNSS
jgi:hypothetical protein